MQIPEVLHQSLSLPWGQRLSSGHQHTLAHTQPRMGQPPAAQAFFNVNSSTYCYRCDDFVVNDTKLGLVQKVREHLQNLENSAFTADRHRKRKLLENSSLNSKLLKVNVSN